MKPHYIRFKEGTPVEQEEYRTPAGDIIIIDLDEEGRTLGVEVLLNETDDNNSTEEA